MRSVSSEKWVLICNGEVYNHESLAHEFGKEDASELRSDVEIILWMLERNESVETIASRLDGDFAFVALDTETSEFVAARDPIGVRPLFYGLAGDVVVAMASEAKALVGLEGIDDVRVFPPGHTFQSKKNKFESYACKSNRKDELDFLDDEAVKVRAELVAAVRKRIEHGNVSNTIGVLCSGGVDSAAITCIARDIISRVLNRKMRVFTMRYNVGRSDDAFYAGLLCENIGVDHRTFEFGPEDIGDDTLADVVRACETCDPNTIRAAIPMYLLAKAIRENAPEVRVVLSGEGADELFGGYNYFRLAPDAGSASAECDRLLKNLHMFDLLRADRCFAAHGLEVRVPFLDPALVACVQACEGRVNGEKQLLRDAVADIEALSRFRIIDRPKEKFSDGAGYTYVPDLLRRIASSSVGGDDGTLATRLALEKAHYKSIFDREFAAVATRDKWVVDRELPKWDAVEARRMTSSNSTYDVRLHI